MKKLLSLIAASLWAFFSMSQTSFAQSNAQILSQLGGAYKRTAAEISAGVTPVQYFIAPCNVNRYGINATPGTTDMTTAIQTAANVCSGVYIPSGTYLVGSVVIPNTIGLTIHGDGNSSVLQQKSTGSVLSWSQSSVASGYQIIRDLQFNTLNGVAHTINTTGTQILRLQNLYFSSCPVAADCIYANGAASTTAHDLEISDVQIYNGGNLARAGIELGPLQFDTTITHVWMNGNFNISYGIYLNSGAGAIKILDSSPYNMKNNDIVAANNNNYLQLNHNVLGPTTTGDIVDITASSFVEVVDNFFEGVPASYDGIKLSGTSSVTLVGNIFLAGAIGAGYIVHETSGADYTSVTGGGVSGPSNFASGIYSLSGSHSSVCAVPSAGVSNSSNCGTVY